MARTLRIELAHHKTQDTQDKESGRALRHSLMAWYGRAVGRNACGSDEWEWKWRNSFLAKALSNMGKERDSLQTQQMQKRTLSPCVVAHSS